MSVLVDTSVRVEHLRQHAPEDTESAAAHRARRRAGEAPRSRLDCLDCLVAAVAVRHAVPVLHRDRDHDVLARHTDLQVVTPRGHVVTP